MHVQTLLQNKYILRNTVMLSHAKPSHLIFAFMHASNIFWAGIVAQMQKETMCKLAADQRKAQMPFVGTKYVGAHKNWKRFGKEAYNILWSSEKMN